MSRLVVVVLVVHDLELLAHFLAAGGHSVDGMIVVGHVGPLGDVLVGDQQRLAVLHLVGECSPVHHRAHVAAPQLAVAPIVDVLVGGGVAHGEDELLAHAVEDLRRQGGRHRVRIVAGAERRSRRGRGGFRRPFGRSRLGGGGRREEQSK